jgi:hypothetical protein
MRNLCWPSVELTGDSMRGVALVRLSHLTVALRLCVPPAFAPVFRGFFILVLKGVGILAVTCEPE